MNFDVVVLTDNRYINPTKKGAYVENILLEDHLILEALQEQGLSVIRKSWDDPNFDWSTTKYALFRTTWDYFDRLEEFSKWFGKTAEHTQFINPKALIEWNIDKHYLRDLHDHGINIPNTIFIEREEQLNLEQALEKADMTFGFQCNNFVLKPCVSGAARHTYKFNRRDLAEYDTIFQKLIAQEAMMLQEFQHHIVGEGEISLMVFDGAFTHGVLKVAKPGDFRVQDDFGGSVHAYKPTDEQIDFAKRVVRATPSLPLYARVDIFKDNYGEWALAELEIFEPELWFRMQPEAAKVLAKAIKKRMFS
ncbi:ATP-grasp domain-containing protein [Flagellimonas meishanensis]|uniref:ATP-grasp domain-containing protein n=1 Tax=Flagellimonas meishanensis TaxID=2873264 RepID=UPI001CA62B8D|nr:hypothetical protein [[Muricauda] meishanensis]